MGILSIARHFWHASPFIGARNFATRQRISDVGIPIINKSGQVLFKNFEGKQLAQSGIRPLDGAEAKQFKVQIEKLKEGRGYERHIRSPPIQESEKKSLQKESNRPNTLSTPMSFEAYKGKRLLEKRLLTFEEYAEKITANVQKHIPERASVVCTPSNLQKFYWDYTRSSYNAYLYDLGGADYVNLL